MMPRKSLLNPNAVPFVPLLKNLPEMRHEGHDEASKKTLGISDSGGYVGMAESCQVSGSASVQNIQSMQKLQVSDDISSETDEFDLLDEEHDTMKDLDSLASMFPDYSRESLIGLYYANQGNLMETVYALGELENIQSTQKLQVSDEISSETDEFDLLDEEHDTMKDLDSLASMFPDYSRESLIGLYYANQGNLMETVYALGELEYGGGGDDDDDCAASAPEEFPTTSKAINDLSPPCLKSDSAGASSSTSSAHSVHKADF